MLISPLLVREQSREQSKAGNAVQQSRILIPAHLVREQKRESEVSLLHSVQNSREEAEICLSHPFL